MSTQPSTWRVEVVTKKPGVVTAELSRVEWFKRNPDYDEDAIGEAAGAEFIDAEPGEDGAEWVDSMYPGKLKLDITDGPEMHAGDDVLVSVEVLTHPPAGSSPVPEEAREQ